MNKLPIYKKVPIAEIQKIPETSGPYMLYKNHYWAVDDDENVIFYMNQIAQCNPNRKITEKICEIKTHPGTHAHFIENAWMPYDEY